MKQEVKKQVNKPEQKFRAGAISATIWVNQAKNKDKEIVEYRTISVERNYQDKEGKWNSTNSFRLNDLPKVSLVVNKAYEYLLLKQQEVQPIEEAVI